MEHIDDYGCLTQRSQLDRLRELADGTARERVSALQPTELLATTVFVIDAGGNATSWDLDHLPVAGSTSTPAVQLLLDPELALNNLVPTQAIMRILRDTAASAAAVVAPVNASAAALQLADLDHEQSLTARIERPPEREATLGPWDFGKVTWSVRLRQVLQAARRGGSGQPAAATPKTAIPARPAGRTADAAAIRRNHRREMREQLQHQPAAAPSWLQ